MKKRVMAAFTAALLLAAPVCTSAAQTGIALTASAEEKEWTPDVWVDGSTFDLRLRVTKNAAGEAIKVDDKVTIIARSANSKAVRTLCVLTKDSATYPLSLNVGETYYCIKRYADGSQSDECYVLNTKTKEWDKSKAYFNNYYDSAFPVQDSDFNLESHTFTAPTGDTVTTKDTVTVYRSASELSADGYQKSFFDNAPILTRTYGDKISFFKYSNKYSYIAEVERGQSSVSDKYHYHEYWYFNHDSFQWEPYCNFTADENGQKAIAGSLDSNNIAVVMAKRAFPELQDSTIKSFSFYNTYEAFTADKPTQTADDSTFDGRFTPIVGKLNFDNCVWKAVATSRQVNKGVEVIREYEVIGKLTPRYDSVMNTITLGGYVLYATEERIVDANRVQLEAQVKPTMPSAEETEAEKEKRLKEQEENAKKAQDEIDKIIDFFDNYVNNNTTGTEVSTPVIRISSDAKLGKDYPDSINTVDIKGHGKGYLLRDGETIEEYTASEIDNGLFHPDNFDPDRYTYHLKIETDTDETTEGYYFFRYDKDANDWLFRVDTVKTPMAKISVDINTFRNSCGKGEMLFSTRDLNLEELDKEKFTVLDKNWTTEEFHAGTVSVDVPTNPNGSYFFRFENDPVVTWVKNNKQEESRTDYYRVVGIDPVYIKDYTEIHYDITAPRYYTKTPDYPYADIPTNAKKDDVLEISGKTIDGIPVKYEVTQERDADSVPLPAGEFTVTDKTTGIRDTIKVNDDDVDAVNEIGKVNGDGSRKVLNLKNPEMDGKYTITSLDGTILDEGTMTSPVIKGFTDIGISGNKLASAGTYSGFASSYGIVNSANPEDYITEDGYLASIGGAFNKTVSDDIIRGDVNLDGAVNIMDVIKMQKYLLGADTLSFQSLINGDMIQDGQVDVFDLGVLKREILNK